MENIFNWLAKYSYILIPLFTAIGTYGGYLIQRLPKNIQTIINKIGGLNQITELIISLSENDKKDATEEEKQALNKKKKEIVLDEITKIFNANNISISKSMVELIFNLAYNAYKLKKNK